MDHFSEEGGAVGHWRRELGGLIWLVPVGVVLAVVAGLAVFSVAPATYSAERQVLFLSKPTSRPDTGGEINPFLELGPSLYSAGEVLAISVTDERTMQQIAPDGSGLEYMATMLPGSTSPVLVIESKAPSSSQADATADKVVAQVAQNLSTLQKTSAAPKSTWVVSTLLASSATPERDLTRTVVLAVGAVVLVLGAFLLALALVLGARRARGARQASIADEEPS